MQAIIDYYFFSIAQYLTDTSFAAYFATYEVSKSAFRKLSQQDSLSHMHLFLAGGIAGIGAWIPCFPQDVIKSR
jgi:solute carrier family 25 carnitine/acylcarnitine transporter 20/29